MSTCNILRENYPEEINIIEHKYWIEKINSGYFENHGKKNKDDEIESNSNSVASKSTSSGSNKQPVMNVSDATLV
jgi:hypothetical protein